MNRTSRGVSSAGVVALVLVLAVAAVSVVYITSTQGTSDQLGSQSKEIGSLQSQVQKLVNESLAGKGNSSSVNLPVMDQPPTIRSIRETWYLSPSAHQDRFDPSFVVVNQGDTVRLTLIDNDTVAHDFVIGPPYDIIVNATVPGLINDLTQQMFTTTALNNSPGVIVKGTPGNVSASYSFVAKYPGIFEFVCTYHAQVGMIGYLVVLPNEAFTPQTTTASTVSVGGTSVAVSIVPGAAENPSGEAFSPDTITVVLGVNSTVVWTNHDSIPHTVTSDTGVFDSGNLGAGAVYSFTFTSPGTYRYHCTYHPLMIGTVIVKAAR